MSRRRSSGKQWARVARRYEQSIGATSMTAQRDISLGRWRPVAATPGNASARRTAEANKALKPEEAADMLASVLLEVLS